MKYLKYFENLEVEYTCHECGWCGWLFMTDIVICPNCNNKNDVWKENEPIPERHKRMNDEYLKSNESNSIVTQQTFFLTKVDTLYISDDFAKSITPNSQKLVSLYNSSSYGKHINQKNIDFFENSRDENGYYKSRDINPNISVRYDREQFLMNILIKRGNNNSTEFGNFLYYIGGNSGDYSMHGKNMKRATKECNLNFMIKFYPIVAHIKNFYKRLLTEGFLDIIKQELDKDPYLAQYGVPQELKYLYGDAENTVKNMNKYNL